MLGIRFVRPLALAPAAALVVGCDPGPDPVVGPDPTPPVAAVRYPDDAPAAVGGDVMIRWNAAAGAATIAACLSPAANPIHESRLLAMMHVAAHDALNAIDRRSRPYAFAPRPVPDASPGAAVAAAARGVLVPGLRQLPAPFQPCVEAAVAAVEGEYATSLDGIPDGTAKARGVDLGRAAAAAILALRAADGSDTPLAVPDHPQGTAPGAYRFTPGFDFYFLPGWADVTPFVLRRASQFRPPPPYAVTSRRYAADYNEVKALGGDGATTPSGRTPDQTQAALFWVENSPLQWNRIARTVAAARGLGLWENARLFGLLNLALADGYVGTFEAKRQYAFWRPVTAIRLGDSDGNPRTAGDPTWNPLVPTPPISDYDSGHAVEGGAAAEVLARVFGADRADFAVCSYTLAAGSRCDDVAPTLRSYHSFSAAAAENAYSRILVGFHFRAAVEAGTRHGENIGRYVVAHALRPVRGTTLAASP
jgi:hypothetical protein